VQQSITLKLQKVERGSRAIQLQRMIRPTTSNKAIVEQPIALPALRCLPARVVGIPVALANFRFVLVMPVAFFQEKDKPGMPVLEPFLFLAI
jgi:hypothetical protein